LVNKLLQACACQLP